MSDATPNLLGFFDIVYSKDGSIEDFELLVCNKKTAVALGRNPEELPGTRYTSLFPISTMNGAFERVKEVAITGIPADFEFGIVANEAHQWFRCTVSKLNDLIVSTVEIITQRKNAERARLRKLALLQQAEVLAKSGSWEYDFGTKSLPGVMECIAFLE